MNLINNLEIAESIKTAEREIDHNTGIINTIYNEWKKTGRRVNAVDIIMTSVNKLSTITPNTVDKLHDTAKLKLATILMRCMDISPWKELDSKKNIYKKIVKLLIKLQNQSPNTPTGGSLKDIIFTRLSAALSHQQKSKVFVSYEPSMSSSYLNSLFDSDKPEKIYKMQSLSLPEEFDSLVEILQINQDKALKKFKNTKS